MPQLASGAIPSKSPCQSDPRRPRRRYIIARGDTRLAQRWLADAQDKEDDRGLLKSSEMLSEALSATQLSTFLLRCNYSLAARCTAGQINIYDSRTYVCKRTYVRMYEKFIIIFFGVLHQTLTNV